MNELFTDNFRHDYLLTMRVLPDILIHTASSFEDLLFHFSSGDTIDDELAKLLFATNVLYQSMANAFATWSVYFALNGNENDDNQVSLTESLASLTEMTANIRETVNESEFVTRLMEPDKFASISRVPVDLRVIADDIRTGDFNY